MESNVKYELSFDSITYGWCATNVVSPNFIFQLLNRWIIFQSPIFVRSVVHFHAILSISTVSNLFSICFFSSLFVSRTHIRPKSSLKINRKLSKKNVVMSSLLCGRAFERKQISKEINAENEKKQNRRQPVTTEWS